MNICQTCGKENAVSPCKNDKDNSEQAEKSSIPKFVIPRSVSGKIRREFTVSERRSPVFAVPVSRIRRSVACVPVEFAANPLIPVKSIIGCPDIDPVGILFLFRMGYVA